MDRKYIKCVLDKGFALVMEDQPINNGFPNVTTFGEESHAVSVDYHPRPPRNCFPTVSFYRIDGDLLGSLSSKYLAVLYHAFYEVWPKDPFEIYKYEDGKIISLHKDRPTDDEYEIWLVCGFFYIINSRQEKSIKNSLAVIDKQAALRLIAAIDQFAQSLRS